MPTAAILPRLARPTLSAQAAFALAEGYTTEAALAAAGHSIFRLTAGEPSGRFAAVLVQPFGAGADNSTFDFRVYLWVPDHAENFHQRSTVGQLWLYGGGTATLSTSLGGGGLVGASERMADTITFTASARAQRLLDALGGGVEIHTPADNTPGFVMLPELAGAAGLVFEADLTGATGANALFMLID